MEKSSGNSKRLQNVYTTRPDKLDTLKQETLKSILKDKNVDLEPTDMDSFKIKIFGNLCNLKCVMCNPHTSSKIAAEMKRHGEWSGNSIVNPSKKMDMDKFYADLKKVLPTTNQIEIVGGEPLLYPETYKFLNWIVENDLSKINSSTGVIYAGNPKILEKFCPGVYGTIKPIGICMIGSR